jgi:hypothetical protein
MNVTGGISTGINKKGYKSKMSEVMAENDKDQLLKENDSMKQNRKCENRLDKKAVPWKTNQPQKGENKTDTHG